VESNELVEGLLEDLECPKALGKFEAGAGPEHGGDVILRQGYFKSSVKPVQVARLCGQQSLLM
jgi:hypothetical protein